MAQKIGPKELALKAQREDLAKHHKLMLADGCPPKLLRTSGGTPKLKDKNKADAGVTLAPPLAVQKAIAADLADSPIDDKGLPRIGELVKQDDLAIIADAVKKTNPKTKPPKIKQTGVVPLAELAKMVSPKPKAEKQETVMRSSKQKKTATTKARKPVNGSGKTSAKGSKKDLIAGLLKRKEGCTTADVLKACNWPSVSMPAAAKSAGLKLKKEKEKGQPMRYYAA